MAQEVMDASQYLSELVDRNKRIHEMTKRGDSEVQRFYCGTTVFMTGGSGFLGKQLIEKLSRTTNILKIFVLLRPKKGKDIKERLDILLNDPVYNLIREQQPGFVDKIVPIAGDVAELRLGMSEDDWNTVTEEVNVIFHMAATVRFDEPLFVATMTNVRGTREALLLGKACRNLKSYVHVSTAYSHACKHRINGEVLEDFYQSPIKPEILIEMAESMEKCRLDDITPSLTKEWPNTYSFTKAVAEELVRVMSDELPICVVRPAVVISALREPEPGWVDISNMFGASGLILGCTLGVTHVTIYNQKMPLALIPVDFVNNVAIAAAWETAQKRAAGDMKAKVYTVTSTTRNPCLFKHISHIMKSDVQVKYPSPSAISHCLLLGTNKKLMFWLLTWLLHFIPGYILDGVCFILGKERRFVKLYTKAYKLMSALSYFTLNSWKFIDNNTSVLYDSLSTVDQQIFNFDVNKIDWREYMTIWILGIRKHIIKDGLVTVGWKKRYFIKYMTYAVAAIYFYALIKVLFLFKEFIVLFYKLVFV